MIRIFLSYRRDDSNEVCGRIYDWLRIHIPGAEVFRDVYSLKGGVDFRHEIQHFLLTCDVVLGIIGPNWLGPTDRRQIFPKLGKHFRIHEPEDMVRNELEVALSNKIPIVIILVNGASMPKTGRHDDSLPTSLEPLLRLQYEHVRIDPDFSLDMARVQEAITACCKKP